MARDDDDSHDDDIDSPPRFSSSGKPPSKVSSIGIMCLIGGILGVIIGISWGLGTCCLWPGAYYSIVMGILAIIKGSALMGAGANQHSPPIYIGVMMIINIINVDIINCVLGIMVLVFCGDDEVKDYMRK